MAATGKEAVTLEQFKLFAESQGGFDIDKVYPVGSVYFSMSSVNPSSLFGGTWQKIEGRFILTSDSSRQAGDTGGSNDAVVISHSHGGSTNSSGNHTHDGDAASAGSHNHTVSGGSHSHSASSNSTGSHTHTPSTGDTNYAVIAGSGQARLAGPEYKTPYYYVKSGTTRSSGSHTHTITVKTNSSHSHTIDSNGAHTHSLSIDSGGAHTHTIDSEGVSGTGKNMPAYLVINAWQRTA